MSTAKKDLKLQSESAMELVRLGHLHFEKCDLPQALRAFEDAFNLAKKCKNPRVQAEALVGLLRYYGETQETEAVQRWDSELSLLQKKYPDRIPVGVWYLKGALAVFREDWKVAQRHFHHYLQTARSESGVLESERKANVARAMLMLASVSQQSGHLKRARYLGHTTLQRYESHRYKGINGMLYLVLGQDAEIHSRLAEALDWYRKAHAAYLEELNWYYHLWVLLGYARVARHQQNYAKAYFYLDLIEKVLVTASFGVLKNEVKKEKLRLETAAVDLLIDSKRGVVKTREGGTISLRKQYVLLDILRALTRAHRTGEGEYERGLSKAEIIEQVWHENYRPSAHDNKLYYNINRLRRLIEPNFRNPQYLLSWKEGYRLAPGLRVQWIGSSGQEPLRVLDGKKGGMEHEQ